MSSTFSLLGTMSWERLKLIYNELYDLTEQEMVSVKVTNSGTGS
jgi:hypothetical protein